ncbi:MAG: SDR family oxidoreductase [Bacteroidales bacterium]|jgi:short-subunit dehydrogenase|nr:SDR family oxidoreductase [Bacteroidales bacterium]
MNYFNNKTIWITGASSGIGRECAVQLSRMPQVSLILSARSVEKLQELHAECVHNGARCEILPLDLEQTDTLAEKTQQAIALFGKIDIFINNGGISQRSLAQETPIENDRKIMEIDYFSGVIITKALLPHMIERKSGHIVAVSSISGCFGFPQRTAYCAAKHAMYGYFEALDIEMRAHAVAVTIVSPGRIQTNISYSALTKDGTAHGKMDEGQASGMSVQVFVKQMLTAISRKKHEILIGRKEVLMVYIYRVFPKIFHIIAGKIKAT